MKKLQKYGTTIKSPKRVVSNLLALLIVIVTIALLATGNPVLMVAAVAFFLLCLGASFWLNHKYGF